MKAIAAYLAERGIRQVFLQTEKDTPAYSFRKRVYERAGRLAAFRNGLYEAGS